METPTTKPSTKQGFSLTELAAVLLIVGLLISYSVKLLGDTVSTIKYSDTKKKLVEIKQSLSKFYLANGRLPCPAQLNLKAGDTDYGIEIYSETFSGGTGGCDRTVTPANSAAPPYTLAIDAGGGRWIRQGALPIKALGLANDLGYDAYGNKFTYVVTETFTSGSISSPSSGNGAIVINDGVAPTIITSVAVFAVISHGADQKGAYSANGTLMASCNSTLGRDNENCDNTDSPADSLLTEAMFRNLRNSSSWFDDMIIWAAKNEIIDTDSD